MDPERERLVASRVTAVDQIQAHASEWFQRQLKLDADGIWKAEAAFRSGDKNQVMGVDDALFKAFCDLARLGLAHTILSHVQRNQELGE